MNRYIPSVILGLMLLSLMGVSRVAAAERAKPEGQLTGDGEKLLSRYTEMLEGLQARITRALPKTSAQQTTAYLEAREAETAAEAEVKAAQQRLGEIAKAQALVGHAKGKWIGGADNGIAVAQEKLKNATTQAERKAAQEELGKWQKSRQDGVEALKERQAALDELMRQEPKLKNELEAARRAHAQAKVQTLKAVDELGLASLLSSDKLDSQLAKYIVLSEATPRGLAEFAQQSKAQEYLVEKLLADSGLMKQMVVADGAGDGKYGQAMKIYSDIQKASAKARTGTLQRLALAVSLEHAAPIAQRNPGNATDAPTTVDPVNRYLSYEKAYLNDELDPGFGGLSVWDYRMVVDGNEPDETLAWGREMLHNYRPDHIYTSDYRWRYVAAVRTDIRYGSQDNQYDQPEMQFFQNILKNGGVCGRRAFFGRFILRAFGIPTIARPQRGHAALAHWTPDGWVICLGAGWGHGWVGKRNSDLDFLAITQARNNEKAFMQVKRAQWVGDVMGEKRTFGFGSGDPAFWNGVALYTQRGIIEDAKVKTLDAVGEELGEANESSVKYAVEAAKVTDADRKIVVARDGAITIPAVACSNPTKSTGKIIFMPSNLGGKQLHYSRNGGNQDFEYTFAAPAAGTYALTARVVTPSWQQHLLVSANGGKPVDLALPHTVGMWDTTKPVQVELVKGENVLRFSHRSEGHAKGVTIRDFTLRPLK